jgi:hypothetical protein
MKHSRLAADEGAVSAAQITKMPLVSVARGNALNLRVHVGNGPIVRQLHVARRPSDRHHFRPEPMILAEVAGAIVKNCQDGNTRPQPGTVVVQIFRFLLDLRFDKAADVCVRQPPLDATGEPILLENRNPWPTPLLLGGRSIIDRANYLATLASH